MTSTEKFLLPGPAGKIEIALEPPHSSTKKLMGIVCHPHPLHQGTMNNKVVTTVIKVFQSLDIVPIRFNFRGVGQSEGAHGYGIGELDDLRTVIKWAEETYPDYRLVLAGFSFGSYIATKVATEVNPAVLITLAPPVHHNDFYHLPPIHFPWIVVQGEADEVVPVDKVFEWLDSLPHPPCIIKMPGVSHFFHGELITLRDTLIAELKHILREHQ